MLECHEVVSGQVCETELAVVLNYEQRQKSRAKAVTQQGPVVAWFIERGRALIDGDCLKARDGTLIRVVAAEETVSEVQAVDPLQLVKAAYHLGNRHVPLQIGSDFLRYQHDHVLDDMVRGLGLSVTCANKPFHPEPGAYNHTGHHRHVHDLQHNHGAHEHSTS